jgi:hypothetical protein
VHKSILLRDPAATSECAGYIVVACFTCVSRLPSEVVLREFEQIAEALDVKDALIVSAAGGDRQERARCSVIPLPRTNGSDGRRSAN